GQQDQRDVSIGRADVDLIMEARKRTRAASSGPAVTVRTPALTRAGSSHQNRARCSAYRSFIRSAITSMSWVVISIRWTGITRAAVPLPGTWTSRSLAPWRRQNHGFIRIRSSLAFSHEGTGISACWWAITRTGQAVHPEA